MEEITRPSTVGKGIQPADVGPFRSVTDGSFAELMGLDATLPELNTPPPLTELALWRRYDHDEQRLTSRVSEVMLDLAGVCRGQRVLDIATGRGEPALRAAARVAPEGVVVGTDRSSDMLAFACERAAGTGIANLTLKVTNAETLEGVPDSTFDVALCRWGLMYLDQPRRALASVRQRLTPGGIFVSAVWAEPARVSYWSMPRDVLARHASVPPVDTTASGTFHYAQAERLREDLASAGFSLEHEEYLSTPVMEAATPSELIEWCLAFGLARMLAGHPLSVRDAWQHDMIAEAPRYRDADGMYRLGGVTRLVVARAPGDRRGIPPQ